MMDSGDTITSYNGFVMNSEIPLEWYFATADAKIATDCDPDPAKTSKLCVKQTPVKIDFEERGFLYTFANPMEAPVEGSDT